MRIFGLEITRASVSKALSSVSENRGGWYPLVRDWWPGAWQHNAPPISFHSVLANPANFACQTLIASDIAKLRLKLVGQDANGIWSEVRNPAYDPVIRHPNPYQNRIQFWENWFLSKLMRGNTYALKFRDERRVVTRLYILDPNLVRPLVADDGSVFYELRSDNLTGLPQDVTVPAREIIHDRFNCLFHPLVGVSPIFAAGSAAMLGINIQNNSTTFFGNAAMPGGILTAPGRIEQPTADRLQATWEKNYSGDNRGKVAVLGDGLKFEPIMMKSVDAQLIEQLKWTSEIVCSTYHVPPYKIGIGPMPTYNNIQSLNVEYYSQCLQRLIEDAELCIDEGLELKNGAGIAEGIGVEFDLDGLLRMDSVTQLDVLEKAKSVMTLDERRKRLELKPITGGDTVYLQQQDHSIEAIAARDQMLIEQAKKPAALPAPAADQSTPPGEEDDDDAGAGERDYAELILRAARRHERQAA